MMRVEISVCGEVSTPDLNHLLDTLDRLLQPPAAQPFRFRSVTVDLRGGYTATGDISMFTLHDDKGADITFGPPGNDADGNPAVPPKNLTCSVVESPPLVKAAMLSDGSGFSADAIPGLPLGVSTVRVVGGNGFSQDFGITIVAEDGTAFPNATIGAERPSTAAAGTGTPPPPATLPTSFPGPAAASLAAFQAAVNAYTGPEEVDLDSLSVKAGAATPPSAVLAYFSHSADGSIDMVSPTN